MNKFTTLAFVLTVTTLTSSAFARSPIRESVEGVAAVSLLDKNPNIATVLITGEAAETLYNMLDVNPVGSFGIVQTQTKTSKNTRCVQAIMGDVPGEMTEARYSCTIAVSKK